MNSPSSTKLLPDQRNFKYLDKLLKWTGLDYVLLIKVWAAHTVCLPVCHLYSRDKKDSLKKVNSFLFHTLTAACQCCKARVTKY